MSKGYNNLINIGSQSYSMETGVGCTLVTFTVDCALEASMVRFNIRGSDIYVEFGEEGVIKIEAVPIKFRARLVRERFLKLFFTNREEILATMPVF